MRQWSQTEYFNLIIDEDAGLPEMFAKHKIGFQFVSTICF
jgi:hypothetical protein